MYMNIINKMKIKFNKGIKIIHNYLFKKEVNKILRNNGDTDTFIFLFKDQRDKYEEPIAKIRHIATGILSYINELSENFDFEFFLAYGSLLGAIRHDGFIPWDDDLDIMMTKNDFNKFVKFARFLPSHIKVFPVQNNFVKVMDLNSIISKDGKRGVAVDIFILSDSNNKYGFENVHTSKTIELDKEDIYPLKKHSFESLNFSIPNGYDYILTTIYGDYMTLPPIENRVYQHIEVEKTWFAPVIY